MVGCMTESTVGISASLRYYLADYVDSGAALLADIASGCESAGRLYYPDAGAVSTLTG